MRQKMISNEINLLRDTFQRLIRRKANTNLGKLIDKTHPADLALLFRFFNEVEQNILFSIMKPNDHTGEFLGELDESMMNAIKILNNLEKSNVGSSNDERNKIASLFFAFNIRSFKSFSEKL